MACAFMFFGIGELNKNDLDAAVPFTLGNAVFFISGATCMSKSKKYISNSVDIYNSGVSKSASKELKFGITGNGVGLVLSF